MKKGLLSTIVLTFVLAFSMVGLLPQTSASAHAETSILDSGSYGDLSWSIDSEYTLRITGDGDIKSAAVPQFYPWYNVYHLSIKSIIVGEGVSSIGNSAFSDCSNMTGLSLPSTLKTIGSGAFSSCSQLSEVTLPVNLTSIASSAFGGCGLTGILIPAKVTSLSPYAFSGCNLSEIRVSSDNETLDSRENCQAVIDTASNELILGCTGTVIPDTVTKIGDAAFQGVSISSISIPDSVKEIGDSAFIYCSKLTSVTIPESVTSLDSRAFAYCTALSFVSFAGEQTSIGENVFTSCPIETIECCKDSSAETYAADQKLHYQYHDWADDYTVEKESTCTSDGLKAIHCSSCDARKNVTVIPGGHTVVIDEAKEATCTEDGLTEGSHCSVCKEVLVKQEVIPAGHSYGDWIVTSPATCLSKGLKIRVCSKCKEIDTEYIEKSGHSAVTDAAVEATCTESGLTEGSHCSDCGAVLKEQEVTEAKGHDYGEWVDVIEASCLAKGLRYHVCSRCKQTEFEATEKLTPTIKLSARKKTIKKKRSYTLVISNLGKGDSVKSVRSGRKAVAAVKKLSARKYRIRAKKKGRAVITVRLASGLKAQCIVKVK